MQLHTFAHTYILTHSYTFFLHSRTRACTPTHLPMSFSFCGSELAMGLRHPAATSTCSSASVSCPGGALCPSGPSPPCAGCVGAPSGHPCRGSPCAACGCCCCCSFAEGSAKHCRGCGGLKGGGDESSGQLSSETDPSGDAQVCVVAGMKWWDAMMQE